MFIVLLILNFFIALAVSFSVVLIFKKPIGRILQRLVSEEIYKAWSRYIIFAIYVVGTSGGVRVWDLEKYLTAKTPGGTVVELTSERWVLEIYGTILDTLQACAWMLLVFFLFALIAYVIVKSMEMRKG
jgi:hypothetical protein